MDTAFDKKKSVRKKDSLAADAPLCGRESAAGSGRTEEIAAGGQKSPAEKEAPEQQNLLWEEVRTEHVVRDEWIDLRRSVYRFPDGRVSWPYYSYTRRDYVVIIALDEEGRIICVRQFRQGIRTVTTEFPAGGIERQEISGYRALQNRDMPAGGGHPLPQATEAQKAAQRELQEETGYASDHWIHLITIPADATISDNYAYVYVALHCHRVSGQNLDETEFVNVRLHTVREIDQLIGQGGFQQAVHVMAWFMAKEKGLLETPVTETPAGPDKIYFTE